MMRKTFYILCFFIGLLQTVQAQDSKPTYFESAPNNMVRFFYDKNYYLVDKNCEFKFIERVATFNTSKNIFSGIFKDFDPNGRLVLTGQYIDGKKDGVFTAYHPNGKIKWETQYQNDVEIGSSKYYYPDGKPMLELLFHNGDFSIINYYDRFGRRTVVNGDGEYDITMPIGNFSEHGFTKYNRKGKIHNGKPIDTWVVSFVGDDKRNTKYPVVVENYELGALTSRRISEDYMDVYFNPTEFYYVPIDYFSRAEALFSKNCSYDQHIGFNQYIANKFNDFLRVNGIKVEQGQQISLSYKVNVLKNGTIRKINTINYDTALPSEVKVQLTNMVNTINWYLPSYDNHGAIDDILSIEVNIYDLNNVTMVSPAIIHREKGS